MRQVNLIFDKADLEQVSMLIRSAGCTSNEIELVIGYLSTWGFNYSSVDIHLSTESAEFTAYYRKDLPDSPAYVTSVVFDKNLKKYGFHS